MGIGQAATASWNGKACARRGSSVLWTAHIWVVLIIGLAAFAVDLGKYLYTRAATRDAVDAAALAASSALENGADPRAAAVSIINQNNRGGVTIDSSVINVITGRWNPVTRSFTPYSNPANAVQVTSSQPYNGGVFARPSTKIEAASVAHFEQRDVVLVLDYSGSMLDKERYKALKEAVKDFCDVVDEVGNGKDRVAMVSYSDVAVLQSTYTTNLGDIRVKIDGSVFAGATNVYDGLKKALDLSTTSARPAADRMVILLTDGLANRPDMYTAYPWAKAQGDRAASLGIPVYTISFGVGADPTLMQYIADVTRTRHYHVEDPTPQTKDDLCKIFRELAAARGTHFVK